MAGQHPYYGEEDFLHRHEEAGATGGARASGGWGLVCFIVRFMYD